MLNEKLALFLSEKLYKLTGYRLPPEIWHGWLDEFDEMHRPSLSWEQTNAVPLADIQAVVEQAKPFMVPFVQPRKLTRGERLKAKFDKRFRR